MAEVTEGADGGRDSSGEEVVGDGESFQIGKVFEEIEVAGEPVGGDVQHAEAREGGELWGDWAGEEVVGEVEDLELSAVKDLGRESAKEVVVGEREFFELREASNGRGQNTVEVVGFEDESGDSEGVGFLAGELPPLAEHALCFASQSCGDLTVDSEVLLQS